MTKVRRMNAEARFELANELVERICAEPEFDNFFMKFYNGKTLELDDDPIGEFERQRKLKISKINVEKSPQTPIGKTTA
jgi:hypothetical protein